MRPGTFWDAVLHFTDQSDLSHSPTASVWDFWLALGTERSEPASSSAPVLSPEVSRVLSGELQLPQRLQRPLDSSAFLLRLP